MPAARQACASIRDAYVMHASMCVSAPLHNRDSCASMQHPSFSATAIAANHHDHLSAYLAVPCCFRRDVPYALAAPLAPLAASAGSKVSSGRPFAIALHERHCSNLGPCPPRKGQCIIMHECNARQARGTHAHVGKRMHGWMPSTTGWPMSSWSLPHGSTIGAAVTDQDPLACEY